jgi:hypothetical protein
MTLPPNVPALTSTATRTTSKYYRKQHHQASAACEAEDSSDQASDVDLALYLLVTHRRHPQNNYSAA